MWNGLVWFFDKLGWTLKKWNGLVIDLVMVNYIICTIMSVDTQTSLCEKPPHTPLMWHFLLITLRVIL